MSSLCRRYLVASWVKQVAMSSLGEHYLIAIWLLYLFFIAAFLQRLLWYLAFVLNPQIAPSGTILYLDVSLDDNPCYPTVMSYQTFAIFLPGTDKAVLNIVTGSFYWLGSLMSNFSSNTRCYNFLNNFYDFFVIFWSLSSRNTLQAWLHNPEKIRPVFHACVKFWRADYVIVSEKAK
jgi:hypothetical protein